jgi:hypothetical protein
MGEFDLSIIIFLVHVFIVLNSFAGGSFSVWSILMYRAFTEFGSFCYNNTFIVEGLLMLGSSLNNGLNKGLFRLLNQHRANCRYDLRPRKPTPGGHF